MTLTSGRGTSLQNQKWKSWMSSMCYMGLSYLLLSTTFSLSLIVRQVLFFVLEKISISNDINNQHYHTSSSISSVITSHSIIHLTSHQLWSSFIYCLSWLQHQTPSNMWVFNIFRVHFTMWGWSRSPGGVKYERSYATSHDSFFTPKLRESVNPVFF